MTPTRTDRAGRPLTRTYATGRAPVNKGKRSPPNPPTSRAILAAIATLGDGPQDRRLGALIAILWRGGLALSEALALTPADLDADAGAITVVSRRKAGNRQAAMDAWGFERVADWQQVRADLPPGPLLCVIRGTTAGQRWSRVSARAEVGRLGARAGVPQLGPRQLRYAHAEELLTRGVPLPEAFRQLGLSTARNNRAPAIITSLGPRGQRVLTPPKGDAILRRDRRTPRGDAYALTRRALQAADTAYRQAHTRAAKRAWNAALAALQTAEEQMMLAATEDANA